MEKKLNAIANLDEILSVLSDGKCTIPDED